MKSIKARPRASLLIESLRDIGYSLESALADIIDNSLTAGARNIDIMADTEETSPKIAVIDDGKGMTKDELIAAMRLGCRSPREKRRTFDLGRFGLGLKTASFSQCRKLTVISKCNGTTSAACWDLDLVASKDDWLVRIIDEVEKVPWSEKLGNKGTLVLWENLDRIEPQDFVRRLDSAREHLELVFHRFLSGERGLKRTQLRFNERPTVAFDPFNSRHPATIVGPQEKIQIGQSIVVFQTFTLPHHKKVTPEEWKRYAGRGGYQKNQGFYVYREKRLIIHGTWFGLARQSELTKLARVRIDMPNDLDSDWKIDVKKASAQPPYQVRERLRRIIETIGLSSKRVYTVRGKRLVSRNRIPVWNRVKEADQTIYRVNTEHPLLSEFSDGLSEDNKRAFERILEVVGAALPLDALFSDMGGSPESVSGNDTSDDTLKHAATTTLKKLLAAGISQEDAFAMMGAADPFRVKWDATEKILTEWLNGEGAR